MRRSWIVRILLIILVAAGVAACDDETPTTPTTPAATVTDTFSGNVNQNGAQTHSFSTAAGGRVTATLKQVAPDSALIVGFDLGNWNGSSCLIVLRNATATTGAVLAGTMSGIGELCVSVYDVGNIGATSPAAYTVEVVHP